MNKEFRIKGQSLFEIVVAIAISALIIVAIVSLVTNSVRNAIYSKNESAASDLAQKTIEWLRGERDQNTQAFLGHVDPTLGGSTIYCFKALSWTEASHCLTDETVQDTIFIREGAFTVTDDPVTLKTIIEAEIDVTWTDSQGDHKVINTTNFTDWRQRQ